MQTNFKDPRRVAPPAACTPRSSSPQPSKVADERGLDWPRMGAPPAAEDAFEALARGGLRARPLEAWALVERAWPELERRLAVLLRALAVAHEFREDCGQEVLLRVWRGRDGYRGGSRGELLAWLARICEREHARLLEARARRPRSETDEHHDDDETTLGERAALIDDPTAQAAEHTEALRELAACIAGLGADERRVVELLYSADAPSEREVALVIEVSKSQVNVLRQRALERLAECLRRKGVEA